MGISRKKNPILGDGRGSSGDAPRLEGVAIVSGRCAGTGPGPSSPVADTWVPHVNLS